MAGGVIIIRPMHREDVPAVSELEQLVYPQPWSPGVFLDELQQERRAYFVADEGGRIIGYAGLLVVADEAHVTTVAVEPGHRGRGVGGRLMLALAEAALELGARHLTLEVRASNRTAQELYRRFGFAPVGVRKNYYPDEDALVMWAVDIDGADYRRRLEEIRGSLAGGHERKAGGASA